MNKTPVTKLGEQLLRDELQHLKHVERPAVITAISEARAQGDLSENADYDAAKEKQGFVEGRIIELEAKLANAQVIDPATLDADGRVVFGATVLLEDLENSNEVRYQIVGDDEADIKVSKISISSPIARALQTTLAASDGFMVDLGCIVDCDDSVRRYFAKNDHAQANHVEQPCGCERIHAVAWCLASTVFNHQCVVGGVGVAQIA